MQRISIIFCLTMLLALTFTALAPAIQPLRGQDATPVAPAATDGGMLQMAGLSPVDSSGDWARIQASGILTVGTASGSPPFAFYTPAFELDGYDVALMTAIADSLGLKLALVDNAFEGLPAALQLGNVDAVAAALTVTPERAAVFDFSMPYYSSTAAVLAPAASALNNVDLATLDFTNLRVGVQRGTIYEAWAKQHLIDAGRMPLANLQTFGMEGEIAQALTQGRIDLGMTDLLPAQEYIRQGGVKEVGAGQVEQDYAIAVRQDSSLLPYLNLALTQLRQNGTLAALHDQYLAADEGGAPPAPTPAPTPAPACLDSAAYVRDVTYDDSNGPVFVPGGQPFVKSWVLLNNGTCTWGPGYMLYYVPVSGSRPADMMSGAPAAVQGTVAPGQQYTISVPLVAPTAPGAYTGLWQMVNAQNQPFGQRIWVRIQTPIGPAPTPPPPPTPAPGVNFTVDKTSIRAGECVNFRWDVTKVAAVFFYKEGEDFRQHGVAGQDGRRECPQATTKYNLRVEKLDGTAVTSQLVVNVATDADAPYIQYFTANPNKINTGQCTTVSWQVTGRVTSVTIRRDGQDWWVGAPVQGSQPECPQQDGVYHYELEARGPGGVKKATTAVSVYFQPVPEPTPVPPTPTPTATPFIPAPVPAVIDYFVLDTDTIFPGQTVYASWSVGAGVTKVEILIDDAPAWREQVPPVYSNWPSTPGGSPGQTIKYSLVAYGMDGTAPDRQDVYVTVAQIAPEPTPTPEPAPTYAPEPPNIDYFEANPTDIDGGGCTTLDWRVSGGVEGVQLFRDGELLNYVGAEDSATECLYDPGYFTFMLRAYNSGGGEQERSVGVQVNAMPGPIEPDPEPEPEPDPPAPEPEPGGDGGGN